MKKVIKIVGIFIISLMLFTRNSYALEDDKIKLYLFHGDGCPHCAEEMDFLEDFEKNNQDIEIVKYEVWYNEENAEFLQKINEKLNINKTGVPETIIGNTVISGFGDSTGSRIERAIKYYKENEYVDVVAKIKDGTYEEEEEEVKEDKFTKEEEKTDKIFSMKVPIFGKINLKELSMSAVAVVIGLIDGFNPCAMWILLFLISVLIGMKDRKKMWLLGMTFLLTSGLVYLAIMLSWLNVAVKITTIVWIRNLIAVVALIGGVINLKGFFTSNDSGCEVVDDKKRKSIFKKIRKFTSEKSLILAVLGMMGLAISVNLVELACSAGLPLVFTQLLAINNVVGFKSFMYTLLYIIFFMADDFIIFFIAMFTTKIAAISTKYNKYSHLIGGVVMLLIGILLLFKPGWLMFNG